MAGKAGKTWTKVALPGCRNGRLPQDTRWQESMNCANSSYKKKTRTSTEQHVRCKLCREGQESVAQVPSGCSALVHSSIDEIPGKTQCCAKDLVCRSGEGSQSGESDGNHTPLEQPNPMYESDQVTVYWDVPINADQTERTE